MPLAGSKPAIAATEQLQTHALDHAATGIGMHCVTFPKFEKFWNPIHVWPQEFQIRDCEPVEELHFNVMKEGGWQKNLWSNGWENSGTEAYVFYYG
jgi:hypothetical protein